MEKGVESASKHMLMVYSMSVSGRKIKETDKPHKHG